MKTRLANGVAAAILIALVLLFVPTVRASADTWVGGFLRDAFGNLDVSVATDPTGTHAVHALYVSPLISPTASPQVISTQTGRLFSVLITATGTAALTCYDNASAASGTPVIAIPASAAIGNYVMNWPVTNGITCSGSASNPTYDVGYAY